MVYRVSFLWFRSLKQCPQGTSQQSAKAGMGALDQSRRAAHLCLQHEAVRLTQLLHESASSRQWGQPFCRPVLLFLLFKREQYFLPL